ncbi:ABC transporter substrate-binding protein [Motiliproteus sp. SC1-56]|uniref:substrate-binding periplasmic protein n=1 Tax=Motiliproteus sp. SC1-56 TaxID=2799565 RepID=UPI001A8FAC44|nr:transporter substrate-binding domain-containing protein [Motiliproteus sp. SC1-56]
MSVRRATAIFALWLVPASLLAACPVSNVRVGLFDFPPLYHLSATGEAEGQLVNLLDEVMAEAGCTWQPRFFTDTPSAGKSIFQGSVDLMMAIRHPLMEPRVFYGSLPLTQLELNLYHGPATPAAHGPEGLKDKRVAVIRGFGYGGLINQLLPAAAAIDLTVAQSHSEAFSLLFQNQVDYVLDYRGPSDAVLATGSPVPVTWTPWGSEDLFFLVSKHLSDPPALLQALEQALRRVRP